VLAVDPGSLPSRRDELAAAGADAHIALTSREQLRAGRKPAVRSNSRPLVGSSIRARRSFAEHPHRWLGAHLAGRRHAPAVRGFRDRAADPGLAQAIRRETLQPTADTARGRRPAVVGRGRPGAAPRVVGLHELCGVRRRLPLMYEASGMPGGVCRPSGPAGACLSARREVGVDKLYGPRPFADGGGTTLG
jgi:hypothetical protein